MKHPTASKCIADRTVVYESKKEKNPWDNPQLQFNWMTYCVFEGAYSALMSLYTMGKSGIFEGFYRQMCHHERGTLV